MIKVTKVNANDFHLDPDRIESIEETKTCLILTMASGQTHFITKGMAERLGIN